jgi:hypothetical protein
MEKETLKRIFEFLEEKENNNPPFKWKLINNEPLTKEELNVEGSLNLSYSKITQLPKGLKVNGGLYLENTNIKSLPEGLRVQFSLSLSYTKIESLPKGLKVFGILRIWDTPIAQKYTDEEIREMIKPGFIKGEIYR